MNCSIESLVVVNVKLCDLLQSLTKYIPITDSLGERATSDQDRGEREWLLDVREQEWKKHIPKIREREGNEKKPFPKFGNGKGMKKSIPKIREREGNEKNPFPQFGNGKGMKKIHSHNSGMGIRGYHSQEYPGTGTGMKKR